MIHPDTRIQYINDEVGYGIFATQFIPKGTIVYVKDCLEIEVKPKEYERHSPQMKEIIEKYSYIDERGIRVLSWDLAKYVNHCCDANTLSTSYNFDIAIRDIQKGEEMTCEYGVLNVEHNMTLMCNRKDCRGMLQTSDFDFHYPHWDEKVKSALVHFQEVEQFLLPFVELANIGEVLGFLKGDLPYKSVYSLKNHSLAVVS